MGENDSLRKSRVVELPDDRRERFKLFLKTPGFYQESGPGGEEIIDLTALIRDPLKCEEVVDLLLELIQPRLLKRETDYIGRLVFLRTSPETLGILPLVASIVIKKGCSNIIITIGQETVFRMLDGSIQDRPLNGQTVLVIADHAKNSEKLLEGIEIIENLGGKVADVVLFIIDEENFWDDETQQKLAGHGISREQVSSVYSMREVRFAVRASLDELLTHIGGKII